MWLFGLVVGLYLVKLSAWLVLEDLNIGIDSILKLFDRGSHTCIGPS